MDGQEQPAPLLRMLRQLNDTTWSQALLPLLRRDGSAGNVALACRRLRQLCQHSQQELRLTTQRPRGILADAAALAPERFAGVSSVALTICSATDATAELPDVLSAVARLPSLSRLQMAVRVIETNPPGIVAACALQACRQHLSHVCCLKLLVEDGCDECMWRVLGQLSQLTRLELRINNYDAVLQEQRLAALSSLVQLQHLAVEVNDITGPGSCGYLASLSRLTHLSVPMLSAGGLAGVLRAGLGRLQHLELAMFYHGVHLGAGTCAAIAELPELTSLHLFTHPRANSAAGAAELHAALPRMQRLQSLAVGAASPDMLSVLAGMPRLSALRASSWRQPELAAGAEAPALAVCSGLRAVDLSVAIVPASFSRNIPWQAFPAAVDIVQRDEWLPRDFTSVAQHCRGLTALRFASERFETKPRSLSADCTPAQRVAAIRGLAALSQLRRLDWGVSHQHELAALACLGSLRTLQVFATTYRSVCTPAAMMPLAAARHLRVVFLELDVAREPRDASALLCGFGHLQELSLYDGSDRRRVFENALADARALGLPVPGVLSFRKTDDYDEEDEW